MADWNPKIIYGQAAIKQKNAPEKKKANKTIDFIGDLDWLRGLDLNQRPSGYEPERFWYICCIIDVFSRFWLLCGTMCGILDYRCSSCFASFHRVP
jgi:hypothetical protein